MDPAFGYNGIIISFLGCVNCTVVTEENVLSFRRCMQKYSGVKCQDICDSCSDGSERRCVCLSVSVYATDLYNGYGNMLTGVPYAVFIVRSLHLISMFANFLNEVEKQNQGE